MPSKTFKIEFFQGNDGGGSAGGRISDILRRLQDVVCPIQEIDGYKYEIRDLPSTRGGAFLKGFVAKFRSEDLPHIARPGGAERDIEMGPDEGLIEKNYFLYERRRELLIYQSNKHGCTPKILGEYLRTFSGEDVYFAPVLQPEPMHRLLARSVRPKKMEVSFARPGNRNLRADRVGFSAAIMKLLSASGGYRVHLTITPPRKTLLDLSVKDILSHLMREAPDEVRVARVDVEDEGSFYPIDLIADRMASRKTVQLEGRYPVPSEIYRKLNEAYDEHASALRKIFGN